MLRTNFICLHLLSGRKGGGENTQRHSSIEAVKSKAERRAPSLEVAERDVAPHVAAKVQ